MARRKRELTRDEFAGNYTLATREELLAIIEAYRERSIGKDDLRVLAAMLERRALHPRSRVDLHRIVNAQRSVARSLSRARIAKLERELEQRLANVESGGKQVAVSRRMLQYIARGRATCSEAIVLLYYCRRRLRQRRRLERLREGERYARFRYRDLSELSGCARATLCRAVARLRRRGYLATVEVAKLNENHYGGLFVDGPLVSLTEQAARPCVRLQESTTRCAISDNAPPHIPTTPENRDPKTRIQNGRGYPFRLGVKDGVLVASVVRPRPSASAEFARIQERARCMRESWADAVA